MAVFTRCSGCGAHVFSGTACPLCGKRSAAKTVIAVMAGAAAFVTGIGCAYGMPSQLDAGPMYKPDVSVGDATMDAPMQDAGATDSPASD